MKLLVISDSHDNIVRLKHIIGFAKACKADAIIHCGDWNTPLAVKQFSRVKIPVYGVLGNADIDPGIKIKMQKAKIKYKEDFLELKLNGWIIGICHYPTKLDGVIKSQKYDLLLHGHTHLKRDETQGRTRIVNPGALHRTLQPSFALFATDSGKVEFIDIAV